MKNERIKILALEAFQPINDIASEGIADRYTFDQAWFQMYNQKFAELIVKECMELTHWKDFDMSVEQRIRLSVYQDIREHFGVEDNSIKVGNRIKVISGFNVGAKGTVSYIEPTGKIWVRRDGASSDVFYHPEELIGVEE